MAIDRAGEHGGRVDDIEAVDSNPAIVYVGAATSGVWKTENNGTTWTVVRDLDVAREPGIHRVAVDLKKEPVAPGSYMVRLMVTGKSLTAPFEVRLIRIVRLLVAGCCWQPSNQQPQQPVTSNPSNQ